MDTDTNRADRPNAPAAGGPVRREIPEQQRRPDEPADANPDPITGAPGSHPVGTGVGAAAGAATGAAIGMVGGPAGAMVGGAAGAVVGGLVGKGIGEAVDPTEEAYWRESYATRPYYSDTYAWEDYEPAYRLGYNAPEHYGGRDFDEEIGRDLEQHYNARRGSSRLEWDEAQPAVRDAYDRRRLGGPDRRIAT